MVCQNCGKELRPGVLFCAFCGSSVSGETTVVAPSKAFTPVRKPVWVKVISCILSVVMAAVLFLTALTGTVRGVLSEAGVRGAFDSVDYSTTEVDGDDLYEYLYDYIDDQTREYFHLDKRAVRIIVDETNIADFASDVAIGYTGYIVGDKSNVDEFDHKDLYKFIMDNRDVFVKATDGEYDPNKDEGLEKYLEVNYEYSSLTKEAISESVGIDLGVFRVIFSALVYISFIILCLVFAFIIVLINGWHPGKWMYYPSVVFTVVGAVLGMCMLVLLIIPLAVEGAFVQMLCTLPMLPLLIRMIIFILVGVLGIVINKFVVKRTVR